MGSKGGTLNTSSTLLTSHLIVLSAEAGYVRRACNDLSASTWKQKKALTSNNHPLTETSLQRKQPKDKKIDSVAYNHGSSDRRL
jgi:hypothetical protein